MIPILSAKEIKELDAATIKNEPILSIDLMERAAKALTNKFCKLYSKHQPVIIFCGQGNNGGDGLAISRLLHEKKYAVEVFILVQKTASPDFEANHFRVQRIKKLFPKYINTKSDFPKLKNDCVIIDAIFGSGLNKPVDGVAAELISHINKSKKEIVSVDLPSGFFADKISSLSAETSSTAGVITKEVVKPEGNIIRASKTISFQLPKKTFFFSSSYEFVGPWEKVDIGLDEKFLTETKCTDFFIEENDVRKILRPRKKFDHKGKFGHALIVAGSREKMGAAILASKACLLSGAGLTTAHVPNCGIAVLQSSIPDIMCSADINEEEITFVKNAENYSAVAVGCGIGTSEKTSAALFNLLSSSTKPFVLDADALNIISANKSWMKLIPENSILTPHPKEFERMFGLFKNELERNEAQKKFSIKHKIFIVLKGAYTCITSPNGNCFFNSTGNPAMAKGGSGDVLTGMLVSFLAQGYSPQDSCIFATFLHGRAGDIVAKHTGENSFTASQLIKKIPKAFLSITKNEIED